MTAPIRSDRTDLRSYAGEQGAPFSLPPEPHHEPDSWWETWPWLACFLLIAISILLARAWGYL